MGPPPPQPRSRRTSAASAAPLSGLSNQEQGPAEGDSGKKPAGRRQGKRREEAKAVKGEAAVEEEASGSASVLVAKAKAIRCILDHLYPDPPIPLNHGVCESCLNPLVRPICEGRCPLGIYMPLQSTLRRSFTRLCAHTRRSLAVDLPAPHRRHPLRTDYRRQGTTEGSVPWIQSHGHPSCPLPPLMHTVVASPRLLACVIRTYRPYQSSNPL
jgi:hypothetical protein